nr:hypothetical protein BaRGS_026582 [Batillaria attramentaria]
MMDQDSKYVGRHILLPAVLDLDSVSDPPFRSIDGHGPSASPLFSGLATPSYGGFASPPYGGLASPHQGGFATPQYRSDYVTASDAGNSQPQDSDTTEASSDEHCPSGRIISHFSNIPKHRQKDMHGTCVDHGQDEDIEKWEITFGRGLADHDQIDWDRLFNMAGGQRVPKRNLQYGETTFDKLDFSTSGLRVYSRRWYILVVYSLYAFTQACVWNTFGPISSSSKRVFGWGNGMIALLSNLGPISYVLSGVFFSWMLDTNA